MNEILEALYDCFFTPPAYTEQKAAVEANRALLRERIPTAERKLVLRIVDDLTLMAENRSEDSFICGFKLAWQMANELNNYDNRRSTPANQAGLSACSASRESDEI
jgi:hypothetical protein